MGIPHVTVDLDEIERMPDVETALAQSLETFRSAFEYATIGKALVGLEGRCLRANRALCGIVGYAQTELLSLSIQDITHPDDLNSDLALVQQLLAGDIDTYQMEKRYIHADGHSVWCLLSVSLVRDKHDQPAYFVAQIQDITERKNNEQALVASELRFRSVVENSPVGIVARDIDGQVVTHNASALEMLGLTEEQLYHPDEHPFSWDVLDDGGAQLQYRDFPTMRALATGKPVNDFVCGIYRSTTRDRVWLLVNAMPQYRPDGRVHEVLATFSDITERRADSKSVREQADELALVVATQADLAAVESDMERVLAVVATRTRELAKADGVLVALRDGSDMVSRAGSGTMASHVGGRVPISRSMSGLCLTQQKALLCVDAGADSRADPELCRRLGIGSMALVPLQRAGVTIGVVTVVSRSTYAFDERDIQRVQLMASQIAAAMATAAEMEVRQALLAERTQALHIAQESELALREREQRYRAITETASDAIITIDETSIVVAMNPAAEHMFGYSPNELIGAKLTAIIPPHLRERHVQGFARYVATGQRSMSWVNVELTAVRKDGGEFPIEVSFTEYMQGKRRFFGAFMRDITERKQVHSQLQQQALHDVLTGLPNRMLLHDRLNHGIADTPSAGEHMSLLFVDLDRFKEVNDTLGHEVGDQLLQEVARRLSAVVRTTDTVARLGGDEFAIVLPGSDMHGADVIACKVTTALSEPVVLQGHMMGVGGSIGIAVFPTHGREASMLMRHADMAMYSAKRNGSGHAFYTAEHDEQRAHHLALTPDLRRAIGGDELELHYQPKVDLRSGTVSQVEALIRWNHPLEGLVPPSRFIPHAENTGLIEQLSVWTLKAALDQCRKWRNLGMNIRVAVNLSSRNLHDRRLPAAISEAIRLAGVPANGLEIEITETAIMLQPKRAADILGDLHSLGVRVSIDDFGTGYSSLAYLKDLPVDEIKVDRSFVAGMSTHRKDRVIVQAIVDLGHNLGLEVVAEGVEDGASLNRLKEMGCDLAQGYYLSRPLPSADCSTWLAGHSSSAVRLLSAQAHSA